MIMKSDAQLEFEGRIAELFFPGKKVVCLFINLWADGTPEVHATLELDEPMQDSLIGELTRYNLELTPIKDND